jgi:hypothetical protein
MDVFLDSREPTAGPAAGCLHGINRFPAPIDRKIHWNRLAGTGRMGLFACRKNNRHGPMV